MEGLAKNRVTLDPLAEPAVMTANIGRGAARLITVISFNSFPCHGPLAMLVKRSTGIWCGRGRFRMIRALLRGWESEVAISIRVWWMLLTEVPLGQNLHNQHLRFLWPFCLPFYFLFSIFLNMDHRPKHTNGSLREASKKTPVSGRTNMKKLSCSLEKVKEHGQIIEYQFCFFFPLTFHNWDSEGDMFSGTNINCKITLFLLVFTDFLLQCWHNKLIVNIRAWKYSEIHPSWCAVCLGLLPVTQKDRHCDFKDFLKKNVLSAAFVSS